nr:MAG TPA: hypothetical protein [Caudoviricetes sp.]
MYTYPFISINPPFITMYTPQKTSKKPIDSQRRACYYKTS